MNHLLRLGSLKRDDVEYYLKHTMDIMDLASKIPWERVLSYDHAYREKQAELCFPWGSRVAMLDLYLIAQNNPNPNQINPFGGGKDRRRFDIPPRFQKERFDRSDPRHKDKVCQLFASKGSCPYGDQCIYKHVSAASGPPPLHATAPPFNPRHPPPVSH